MEVGRIGFFETDLKRKRTRFSPELCQLLGLPIGMVMPCARASKLIHEQDRAAVQAKVDATRHAPDRGRWTAECRVMHADGSVRWVAISGRRIYGDTDKGPRPARSIATVVDITHLKETETALQEGERRLRLALQAARMGTFDVDIAATEAHIDEQEARLLGLPKGTRIVPVEVMRKRIPLEDLRASDAKQERMTAQRGAYHHEFRLRMPDGSQRWLSGHADIKSGRIFGVNFDITERKVAEMQLRESEARLRVATEGAALGLFERDVKADRTVWVNDRMYEIFGRSREDGPLTRQQFIQEYLHPDDAQGFEEARRHALRSDGNFHVACRIILKDGAQRWIQIDGKFELSDTGERSRLVGVVADITARKRLEARAERLFRHLVTIQEEERRNIAQELHDSTVQHLVAADLMLVTNRQHGGEALKERMEAAANSLRQAMTELRTFSYLTHPPALDKDGLQKTVQRYVDGFSDRSGLVCRLKVMGKQAKYAAPVRHAIFRIVQEGLANAYRHAAATVVSVEFRQSGHRLHVIITDNGRGMPATSGRKPRFSRAGVGIRGMRIRLRQLGGSLKISKPRVGGTRLDAIIPI
jgi:PAS domain S-box-containing protein